MSSGVAFLVLAGLAVLTGQLLKGAFASQEFWQAVVHCGPTVALAAVAGAIRLLIVHAETLEQVTAVRHSAVVTQGMRLGAAAISQFGERLYVDDIFVYAIFAIFLAVVVFELRVGVPERNKSPARFAGFMRYALLGYTVPLFFGMGALFLVYTRS